MVEVGAGRRVAVALDRVIRIEVFDSRAVELAAGVEVVQYGGRLLPLLRLGSDARHVVVYAGARELGLVVGDVVDIFDRAGTPCSNGAAVIDGRVTDIADLDAIAARMGLAA